MQYHSAIKITPRDILAIWVIVLKKTCLSLSLPMHLNSLRAKILKILNINKRINAKFKTSFIMYMYMARHNDVACSLDRTMQL